MVIKEKLGFNKLSAQYRFYPNLCVNITAYLFKTDLKLIAIDRIVLYMWG